MVTAWLSVGKTGSAQMTCAWAVFAKQSSKKRWVMKRDMDIFFGLTPEDTGMAKVGNLWWNGDVEVTGKHLASS
jgi:hypothetical protein